MPDTYTLLVCNYIVFCIPDKQSLFHITKVDIANSPKGGKEFCLAKRVALLLYAHCLGHRGKGLEVESEVVYGLGK